MRSVDTNVLARWLLRDHAEQAQLADAIMAGPIEITPTVLLELGWLLTSVGGMKRDQFADAALEILAIGEATIDHRDRLRWAVDRYRAGADWADMIHVACTRYAGSFVSFDKPLEREAGALPPVRIERP